MFYWFSGQDCVLESITLGQNYHGKLSGCVGVNDVIGHFSDGYDFEIYADACYLMPKIVKMMLLLEQKYI